MSVRYLGAVLENRTLTCSQKMIMVCIADRYNDEKRCAWPSYDQLAAEARLSRRTTMREVASLEEIGLLIIHRSATNGVKNRNEYDIDLGVLEALNAGGGSDTMSPRVVTPCHQGSDTMSPTTLMQRLPATLNDREPDLLQQEAPPSEPRRPKPKHATIPDVLEPEYEGEAVRLGVPADAVSDEFEDFQAYWLGEISRRPSVGKNRNWLSTWRNRCRARVSQVYSRAPRNGNQYAGMTPAEASLARVMAREEAEARHAG